MKINILRYIFTFALVFWMMFRAEFLNAFGVSNVTIGVFIAVACMLAYLMGIMGGIQYDRNKGNNE